MIKKLLPYGLTFAILLAVLFVNAEVFAQSSGFEAPTLLPKEGEAVTGRADHCLNLADKIKTGNIHSWHIPCFVKYFTQVLIGVAGSLSVIFIMIGGYRMMLGTEDNKTKGKSTIIYALIGLAVSLMAWIIVDLALQVATE